MIDVPADLARPSLVPFTDWLIRLAPRDGDVGQLRRYVLDCRGAGHSPAGARTVEGLRRHGSARHRPVGDQFAVALAEAERLYAQDVATARARTAFHESGHATVAIALGRRFRYVTARARDSLGVVSFTAGPRFASPAASTIAAAGPLAEARAAWRRNVGDDFTGRDSAGRTIAGYESTVLLNGGIGDLVIVKCAELAGTPRAVTLGRAHGILTDRWAQVEALAEALAASPRALTYREAVAVVNGAAGEPS